jgi:hypothetical protein
VITCCISVLRQAVLLLQSITYSDMTAQQHVLAPHSMIAASMWLSLTVLVVLLCLSLLLLLLILILCGALN